MSEVSRRGTTEHVGARQAARTRARIVEAAARLFVERGYAGTTIPAIAAEADVAVETVYRSASGKAGLLADAVRAAVAGGSERGDVAVTERPAIRRIIEERDPVRQLQLYAATQPGIWSRVGPLLRVLDAAANSDASLVELREHIATERRHGLRNGLGRMLEERGVLARASPPSAPATSCTPCAARPATSPSSATAVGPTPPTRRGSLRR